MADSSRPPRANRIGLGLLGCGTVGAALVELLAENAAAITARRGLVLEVRKVGVRDVTRSRPVIFEDGVLTEDLNAVVSDPGVDVVVEVLGGLEPAGALVADALARGKPVVTANKELIAHRSAELLEAAAKAGVDLLFEAAVGGAIPLLRPLRESLAGDRLDRVIGIVNGTTNFILTRMTESGQGFAEALADAQSLGYAERDPTADVEGFDAAAKAAIVASVAFGVVVEAGEVYREGISAITPEDIATAAKLGYAVKLVAVAEAADGRIGVRVHPAMVAHSHPLASVRDVFNAVFVEGAAAGELMFYGRGAGGRPTASAVLGDVIDAACNIGQGTSSAMAGLAPARILPIDELESQYYITVDVLDLPGVLEKVAGVTARHRVSIRRMEQVAVEPGSEAQGAEVQGAEARLILLTHTARECDVQATLADLRQLAVVDRVGTLLRVIGADH